MATDSKETISIQQPPSKAHIFTSTAINTLVPSPISCDTDKENITMQPQDKFIKANGNKIYGMEEVYTQSYQVQ
jgi:hypothetical protein